MGNWFRLPHFNLTVNIWHVPPGNIAAPPDLVTVGNLSPGKLRNMSISIGNPVPSPPFVYPLVMILRLPAFTDIRDQFDVPNAQDYVECPAGTGRFYRAIWVDDIAKGFANEHRFAYLVRADRDWPIPIP